MNERPRYFIIVLSFVMAFVLTLLPMPDWAIALCPAWILLATIYWSMSAPEYVNVGAACMVGVFWDVLEGTLLGEHAFALIIVTYLVTRFYSRMRMFPLIQQGFCVFILVLMYQFMIYCIQGFLGALPKSWMYWSSSFLSMLLWPWVYSIMRDGDRRFKLHS